LGVVFTSDEKSDKQGLTPWDQHSKTPQAKLCFMLHFLLRSWSLQDRFSVGSLAENQKFRLFLRLRIRRFQVQLLMGAPVKSGVFSLFHFRENRVVRQFLRPKIPHKKVSTS